jgi:hypothetical protein
MPITKTHISHELRLFLHFKLCQQNGYTAKETHYYAELHHLSRPNGSKRWSLSTVQNYLRSIKKEEWRPTCSFSRFSKMYNTKTVVFDSSDAGYFALITQEHDAILNHPLNYFLPLSIFQ